MLQSLGIWVQIPRTHMIKGGNQLPNAVLWLPQAYSCTHKTTITTTLKNTVSSQAKELAQQVEVLAVSLLGTRDGKTDWFSKDASDHHTYTVACACPHKHRIHTIIIAFKYKKLQWEPCGMPQACNPSTREDCCKSEASLWYKVRSCLKSQKGSAGNRD